MQVAMVPEFLKPDAGGEETSKGSRRACRGGWGQRAPTDWSGTWDGLSGSAPDRRSEELIVALKRGNARGAKGL